MIKRGGALQQPCVPNYYMILSLCDLEEDSHTSSAPIIVIIR